MKIICGLIAAAFVAALCYSLVVASKQDSDEYDDWRDK
jgi:hypothetical protein